MGACKVLIVCAGCVVAGCLFGGGRHGPIPPACHASLPRRQVGPGPPPPPACAECLSSARIDSPSDNEQLDSCAALIKAGRAPEHAETRAPPPRANCDNIFVANRLYKILMADNSGG